MGFGPHQRSSRNTMLFSQIKHISRRHTKRIGDQFDRVRESHIKNVGGTLFPQKPPRNIVRLILIKISSINLMPGQHTGRELLMLFWHHGDELLRSQRLILICHSRRNDEVNAIGLAINMVINPLQFNFQLFRTKACSTQNTEAEGHAQIDMALDHGINFIDTAEMYPVNPVSKETVGRTEEIIGTWFAKTGRRGDVVLATKVSGDTKAARGGEGYSGAILPKTIDASLKRLQTDVIDIYQLHWPMRGSFAFRQNWHYDPSGQDKAATLAHMADVLEAAKAAVAAGKVRHFGLSNESAWGTAMWLKVARELGAPQMISIQNEYSLLCRLFDTDLAELSVKREYGEHDSLNVKVSKYAAAAAAPAQPAS